MHVKDDSTYDIGQSVLKLTEGLQFTLHSSGNEQWYLIEDEARGKVFRIGLPEYTILSLLDGRRTLAEAVAKTVVKLGPHAVDEQGMARIAQWIVESGVARSDASNAQGRIRQRKQKETVAQLASWLNPISTRIPLFNPDKLASLLERLIRPFAGVWFAFLWVAVVVYGGFLLLSHGHELFFERLPSYSRFDLLWFLAAWLVLKLIHEASHAVICKRYGGRVNQCGVLLLLLIPLPYVDVTSSWRFENKYHRILTSFAGMLSELFLASIAMMIFVNIGPGVLRHHIGDLIMAATINTILFNANPLMKFDGYYILSDWLEIPNLATRGRSHVKGIFKQLFFGGSKKTFQSRDGWIIKLYGWAALIWMVLICFSISIAAITLFGGVGLIMAAISTVFWIGIPCFKLGKFLLVGSISETPNRARFCSVLAIATVSFLVIMMIVPAPAKISFPVIVDYAELTVVRAEASGFIDQILVTPGQKVDAGQPLVVLANPDLVTEFKTTQIEKETELLRARMIKSEGQIAAFQRQIELVEAAEQRELELAALVDKLVICSPMQGFVSSQQLDSMRGFFAQPGMEILKVGSKLDLKLVGMVDQDQAKWLKSTDQYQATARIWGDCRKKVTCQLEEIPPRATQTVHRPAFAANFGGPLAVTQLASGETEFESDKLASSSETMDGLKFLRPQVEIVLSPDEQLESRRLPGQMGVANIRARGESLGSYLFNRLSRIASRSTRWDTGVF